LVIQDGATVREALASRGVDGSDIVQMSWGSFVFFSDPDGNMWTLQQLPPRS
jgi:hypothetical protein